MVLGVYRHYKGGIYFLTSSAEHTETNERLAIYHDVNGKVWARPFNEFHGFVEIENARVKRFSLISMGSYSEHDEE